MIFEYINPTTDPVLIGKMTVQELMVQLKFVLGYAGFTVDPKLIYIMKEEQMRKYRPELIYPEDRRKADTLIMERFIKEGWTITDFSKVKFFD